MTRVATFNLWSGRGADGVIDPDRLRAAVRELAEADVDVLAVQEVDRGQPRSAQADQLALVAEAFGAVASRYCPTVTGSPGDRRAFAPHEGDDVPDGASYGVGLVSRRPVLAWRVRRLRGSRATLPFPVPGTGRVPRVLWVPDEPRAALAAVLAGDDGPCTVISSHLSFWPVAAASQLRAVARWARSLPGPRVLAGDLNLPGGLPARLTGWRSLAAAATYPASKPRLQLDHLLIDQALADTAVPGRGVWAADSTVAAGRTLALPVSDHLALVADLPEGGRTLSR